MPSKRDIEWLGFNWKEERYASDYFEQLYQFRRTVDKGREGLRRVLALQMSLGNTVAH